MDGTADQEDYMDLSASTKSLLESDYKLALKFFMNKNFEKSFELTKKLHSHSFKSYVDGVIDEKLFTKIVTLYLTEIGLLLQKGSNVTSHSLGRQEEPIVIKQLQEGKLLKDLLLVYRHDINSVPPVFLFNLFLVYYTNQKAIFKDNSKGLYNKMGEVYNVLNFRRTDETERKFLKQLVDIFVYNVLPDVDEYSMAETIIALNPLYASSIDASNKYLNKIRTTNREEQRTARERLKEQEKLAKLQRDKEQRLEKEARENKDLKYRSLKQIQRENQVNPARSISKSPEASRPSQQEQLARLFSKLSYYLSLTKDYLRENSPIILAVILFLVVSSSFVNYKKINLREKFKETIQMAFKITYM